MTTIIFLHFYKEVTMTKYSDLNIHILAENNTEKEVKKETKKETKKEALVFYERLINGRFKNSALTTEEIGAVLCYLRMRFL